MAVQSDQLTADAPSVVDVSDLTRTFDGQAVLHNLDLIINAGEFVALLGRSGSGKSSLLRILAGIDRKATGSVEVENRTAIAFQDARLLPWKRVIDNVALGLRVASAQKTAADALEEVGLDSRHQQAWPRTLSGGEAQRTSLARALVHEPRLLLLDEPFGALDALTRITMHNLVLNLWDRHKPAVLLVTHDVDEAIALADRILVIREGHIAFEAKVEARRPRHLNDATVVDLRLELLQQLGVIQDQPQFKDPEGATK